MTLTEAGGVYFASVERRIAPTTLYTYRHRYETMIAPDLGSLPIGQITVPVLDRLFDDLQDREFGAKTRQGARLVLQGIFGMAVRHGALPTNPVRDIAQIRQSRARPAPRALTTEELTQLLRAVDEIDKEWPKRELGAMVRFMLATGCRIGEMVAVRWQDVDLGAMPRINITGNIVRVVGKGLIRHSGKTAAAVRTVPVPQGLQDMLEELARVHDPVLEEAIFCNRHRGYRDPKQVNDWFKQALIKAGLDWATSHSFRKTAATLLDEGGITARSIADQLGHRDPSVTQSVYMGRGRPNAEVAAVLNAGVFGTPA
jgi:integrase